MHLKRIIPESDAPCPSRENDSVGVRLRDIDSDVPDATAFRQLHEDAQLRVPDGKRRIF
jgi:hypothetical protein